MAHLVLVPFLVQRLRPLAFVLLLGMAAAFVAVAWSRPLVGDATLIHYSVLELGSGVQPCRQLVNSDRPGTCFMQ